MADRTGAPMRVARRLLTVVGWAVLIPLSLVAVARLVAWDSRSFLIALNALTPVVFLPAWGVAVLAGLLRRWALLGTAVVLVVAHIGFVLPELLAAEGVPSATRSAPTFRILDANVYAWNRDTAAFAEEVRRHQPDVLLLQEATPDFVAGLDATGVLSDLRYRLTVDRDDPFAAFMASRFPLSDEDVVSVRDLPVLLRATVEVEGAVRLYGFHSVAPVAGARAEWTEDLRSLQATVAAERRPIVIAGDFNATWGNRHFRSLLSTGLTDAFAARGRPYEMTWPRNSRLTPPLIRIDHVLTTRHLVVTRIDTGVGTGSDHRPLIADVALR